MPRALDGKFVSKYDTTTPRLPSTSEYSGTPIRGYSSAPEFAVALGVSPAPSTSDDERPQRSRSPFSSTPQKQQSDKEASFLNTTLPKMPSGKFIKQIFQTPEFEKKTPQSDKEESFLNTTYPELPSGKFVKQIFQTPGFQRILAAAIAEVVQKTPGTKIDFGTDSDSEEPSQEPPRRRRRSSRS
uniref:Uncharacterized protein n=1 Tax=Panagrolaimus superbus TaxID=310955 RepID=A0A914ZAH0_9BILA